MDELGDIVAVMVGVAVEGPYTYRVPHGQTVRRGSIVAVPLVGRLTLGVVWGLPKDNFAHNRLKDIERIYDLPPISEELLQLVDWVARYTLAAPGMVLRSVLRSTEALEPERPVTAYRRTGEEPVRLTGSRVRVLDCLADGEAWTKAALVGASGCSPSVIEGLERVGALERVALAPPPIVGRPDPDAAPPLLTPDQQAALEGIRAGDPAAFAVSLLDGGTR
jgi:primosomal protein N' (replication factor Y)